MPNRLASIVYVGQTSALSWQNSCLKGIGLFPEVDGLGLLLHG